MLFLNDFKLNWSVKNPIHQLSLKSVRWESNCSTGHAERICRIFFVTLQGHGWYGTAPPVYLVYTGFGLINVSAMSAVIWVSVACYLTHCAADRSWPQSALFVCVVTKRYCSLRTKIEAWRQHTCKNTNIVTAVLHSTDAILILGRIKANGYFTPVASLPFWTLQ